MPPWHEERLPREELPVLVLFDGWNSFFRDRVVPWRIAMAEKTRTQLEQGLLPPYVAGQRWYAGKGEPLARASVVEAIRWPYGEATGDEQASWLVALVRAERARAAPQTYFVPLALAWEDREDERYRALLPAGIAKVRQQASIGVLADALADDRFARAIVRLIGSGGEIRGERALLRGVPTPSFGALAGPDVERLPLRLGTRSSNTTVTLEDRLFLKAYRRVEPGINPEAEMGRFLTEVAQFRHCVPVAGTLDLVGSDGAITTVALLQGYVENQGDAWDYAVNYLAQFLDQRASGTDGDVIDDPHGGFLALVRKLGQRTGEMHCALALRTGDPAFEPETVSPEVVQGWCAHAVDDADAVLDRLAQRLDALDPDARRDAEFVLSRRADVAERLAHWCGVRRRRACARACTGTITWARCSWCRTIS